MNAWTLVAFLAGVTVGLAIAHWVHVMSRLLIDWLDGQQEEAPVRSHWHLRRKQREEEEGKAA